MMDGDETVIYTGSDGYVKVLMDEDDPTWPLGFQIDDGTPGWLDGDDVVKLVGVLAATFDLHGVSATAKGDSVNEQLLRVAADNDLSVEFAYAKGDGAIIEARRLEPEAIEVSRRDGKYVIGNDPDRDDIRAFRLDRIKGRVAVV